jgi:hypothetical protein
VIKVAKNALARHDNRAEIDFSGRDPLFAKIVEKGPKDSWVRQEKLRTTKDPAEIVRKLGVSEEDARRKFDIVIPGMFGSDYVSSGKDILRAIVQEADKPGSVVGGLPRSARAAVERFRELKQKVDNLGIGDLGFVHQWGLDRRGNPKIADYSFTDVVLDRKR